MSDIKINLDKQIDAIAEDLVTQISEMSIFDKQEIKAKIKTGYRMLLSDAVSEVVIQLANERLKKQNEYGSKTNNRSRKRVRKQREHTQI